MRFVNKNIYNNNYTNQYYYKISYKIKNTYWGFYFRRKENPAKKRKPVIIMLNNPFRCPKNRKNAPT